MVQPSTLLILMMLHVRASSFMHPVGRSLVGRASRLDSWRPTRLFSTVKDENEGNANVESLSDDGQIGADDESSTTVLHHESTNSTKNNSGSKRKKLQPPGPPPGPETFPLWAYEPRPFFEFELIYESKKSLARVGRIHTPHGVIDTVSATPGLL